ncbi:MAG TPA: hypothetical protein VGN07_01920 [Steroidobacteraceae bacterium]|jgi:hypothetical protein
MKERIPWPLKFSAKIVLGILRIDYKLLKRAGIVEHGRMERADFCRAVFDRHVDAPRYSCGAPAHGGLLELGPGDSIATGILGLRAGFSTVTLIDAGPFADLRRQALNGLFASLGATPRIDDDASPAQVLELLRGMGIAYLTQGAASLREVVPGSLQHSFSNSVLQHVYRDELPELIRLLGRAHAPDSYSSHSVNFTDHFSGGFVNRRLPDRVMESGIIKRANLYTNRLTAAQFVQAFEAAGFAVVRLVVDFLGAEPATRVTYDDVPGFTAGIGSRVILRTTFLVRKQA